MRRLSTIWGFLSADPPAGRLFANTNIARRVAWILWLSMLIVDLAGHVSDGFSFACLPYSALSGAALLLASWANKGTAQQSQLKFCSALFVLVSTAASLQILVADRTWSSAALVNHTALTSLVIFVVAMHLPPGVFVGLAVWNVALSALLPWSRSETAPADSVVLLFVSATPAVIGVLSILDRNAQAVAALTQRVSADLVAASKDLDNSTFMDRLALDDLAQQLESLLRVTSTQIAEPLPPELAAEASEIEAKLRALLLSRLSAGWLPTALDEGGASADLTVIDPNGCLESMPPSERRVLVTVCMLLRQHAGVGSHSWLWVDSERDIVLEHPAAFRLIWRTASAFSARPVPQVWSELGKLGRYTVTQDSSGTTVSLKMPGTGGRRPQSAGAGRW